MAGPTSKIVMSPDRTGIAHVARRAERSSMLSALPPVRSLVQSLSQPSLPLQQPMPPYYQPPRPRHEGAVDNVVLSIELAACEHELEVHGAARREPARQQKASSGASAAQKRWEAVREESKRRQAQTAAHEDARAAQNELARKLAVAEAARRDEQHARKLAEQGLRERLGSLVEQQLESHLESARATQQAVHASELDVGVRGQGGGSCTRHHARGRAAARGGEWRGLIHRGPRGHQTTYARATLSIQKEGFAW